MVKRNRTFLAKFWKIVFLTIIGKLETASQYLYICSFVLQTCLKTKGKKSRSGEGVTLYLCVREMVGRQRKIVPQAGILMIERTEISNRVS